MTYEYPVDYYEHLIYLGIQYCHNFSETELIMLGIGNNMNLICLVNK